jgi:hypothetical protein
VSRERGYADAAIKKALGGASVQQHSDKLDSISALVYTGNANKVVAVNAGQTGFELVDGGSGGGNSYNPSGW